MSNGMNGALFANQRNTRATIQSIIKIHLRNPTKIDNWATNLVVWLLNDILGQYDNAYSYIE